MKALKKFYFTFGSDPQYPFPESEFVLIVAKTHEDAIHEFRRHHPNRPGSLCYNAAMSYNEKQWDEIYSEWYAGKEPIEVLTAI